MTEKSRTRGATTTRIASIELLATGLLRSIIARGPITITRQRTIVCLVGVFSVAYIRCSLVVFEASGTRDIGVQANAVVLGATLGHGHNDL